jgi:hypothetical protein
MKSLFLFLFLSISFCATAEDPIIVKGHPLEKKYFKLLDYTDAAKRSDSLKLEAHLSRKAGQIVSFFENNPLYVPTSKESTKNQLGMVLAYSALFLMNTNNGFIDGVISYEEIVSNQKVSLTDVPKDEIIARYQMSHKFFQMAERLAPEDDRIQGWHLSSILRYQKYRYGKVEESVMDKILVLMDAHPVFHLYNALTMNSDYSFGEDREKRIFGMNAFLSGPKSPCNSVPFLRKGEAKKCNTTDKTPFAVPGVMAYMGDVYLKEAQKELSPEKKNEYISSALRQYKMPKAMKPIKIRRWNQLENLNKRINIASELKEGMPMDQDFFQSESHLDMYSCKSCHQDGVVRKELDAYLGH